MNYFWVTQKPQSHKKELENGWIKARPAKIYNHYRETVKSVKKGDLIFFCSRGVISHIGVALSSVINETDEEGEFWRVEIKSHLLEKPIDIANHSEYLLDNRSEKYSPITSSGTAHQGYCSEISEVIAWYLLSRAGVYFKNDEIVELEKSVAYRSDKSASYRISNLNTLMSTLEKKDVLKIIKDIGTLRYSDYKYQNSTTYDIEHDGVRYPPKVVFGISAAAVVNRVLFADEFSGGVNSPCFNILNNLGFNFIEKNDISNSHEDEQIDTLIDDIETIKNDNSLSATERKQLIAARKGQGKFRKSLIEMYGRCLVTGINFKVMLRASHIKPWRVSSNNERLDPYNGLLLSANIDILFDKGLLSFENNGALLVSETLRNKKILEHIGVDKSLRVNILPESYPYLEWHRKRYFSGAE